MEYLELDALSKAYGSAWAVRDLTLGVRRGEVLSLLGPSGCGKTTTLNMIGGFIRPTSGRILLDGQPLDRVPPNRRDTLMVFQSYALFPHMTVAANVGFGLEMRRIPGEERRKLVADALELVGLDEYLHRYPRQLSGGQQQRVALARALVVRPKVLLLDEPLSNLDAKLRQEMRTELRRIQQSVGITTVFVTHDQAEALAISDRIAVMSGGRLEQVGSPVEIYEQPKSLFVANFIGETNVFQATVVGAERSRIIARLDNGAVLSAPNRRDHRPGDPVALLIRPERLRIAANADHRGNRLSGRLKSTLYLGNMLRLALTVPGLSNTVELHLPGAATLHSYRPGDAIEVAWNEEETCVVKV